MLDLYLCKYFHLPAVLSLYLIVLSVWLFGDRLLVLGLDLRLGLAAQELDDPLEAGVGARVVGVGRNLQYREFYVDKKKGVRYRGESSLSKGQNMCSLAID